MTLQPGHKASDSSAEAPLDAASRRMLSALDVVLYSQISKAELLHACL